MTAIERTRSASPDYNPSAGFSVIILDTIGELADLYSIATVVFVGGSLVDQGGHNLLEPVIYHKPVLFGPYIQDFREIAEHLTTAKIGIMVRDEEDLRQKIYTLLQDKNGLEAIAQRARAFLEVMGGATQRNLKVIEEFLSKSK